MLEIKFEHRNYIPSIGILLVLAYLICSISNARIRILAAACSVLVCAACLALVANLWGSPLKASMVWMNENPRSFRAIEHAARQQLEQGNVERAKSLLSQEVIMSRSPTTELRYMAAFCSTYDGRRPDWADLARRIKVDERDWRLYQTLEELLGHLTSGMCDIIELDGFRLLLAGYRNNPAYDGNVSSDLMYQFEIIALLHFGEDDLALTLDEEITRRRIPLTYAMHRAATFATHGYVDYAIGRLSNAIEQAQELQSEDAFTLKNAKEMLNLIKADKSP